MAQTKKAEENKQTQKNNQPQLESNEQTQTPPSRQAGANQRQDSPSGYNQSQGGQSSQGNYGQSQAMTRGGGREQRRGLSRREQYASPFSFRHRFSEEMDRLFDDFGFGGSLISPGFGRGFEQSSSAWFPQTEVFERGIHLVIRADLPGMTKDDIDVDIEEDQIVIRGERRDEREQNEQGFYQTERSYGSFYRSIPLPQGIDSEQANANFQNGVLEITMPKPEQKQRGRRLEIGEGGNPTNQQTSGGESKTTNQ